jgi:DNA (cytosine-5)-methyltransferase 1
MFSQDFQVDSDTISRKISLLSETFTTSISRIPTSSIDPSFSDPHDMFWRSFLRGIQPTFPLASPGRVVIADVFSSVGGLSFGVSLGLRSLGFSVRHAFSVDLDRDALEVLKTNFPESQTLHISAADSVDFYISGGGENTEFSYDPELNHEELHKYKNKISILCGGPPCQGHSNLNNKTRRDDPRNQLFLVMPALAVALNVPFVVIENVPTALNDFRAVVDSTISLFEKSGYSVFSKKLLATNFGGFQTRERLFIIAAKKSNFSIEAPSFFEAFHLPARPVSLPISDLVGKSSKARVGKEIFDSTGELSDENIDRINFLFENNLFDLPNSERPICHQEGTTYSSVYGRLNWNLPAGTITTGFSSPGRGRFIHPLERRPLTPHEAARIQSFPDSFQFSLSDETRLNRRLFSKWIGDAVPPHLAHLVGLFIGAEMLTSS